MRLHYASLALALIACGSPDDDAAPPIDLGTGGTPAPEATGGAPSNGGAAASGGSLTASGGAAATGGGTHATTGGTVGSGGAIATGGAPWATGGTVTASGGAPSSGGAAATGGEAAGTGGQPASPWLPGGACSADAHGCGNRYGCWGLAECVAGTWGKCFDLDGKECPRACLNGAAGDCPL